MDLFLKFIQLDLSLTSLCIDYNFVTINQILGKSLWSKINFVRQKIKMNAEALLYENGNKK